MTIVPTHCVTFVTTICTLIGLHCFHYPRFEKDLFMDAIRLLIFDEHTAVRNALLRRLGTSPRVESVTAAGTLPEAIEAIHKEHVNVVLFGLSGVSHRELRQTIQEVQTLKKVGVAVVVVTSYSDDIEREVVLQAGADKYLLKDINSRQLITEIQEVLHPKIVPLDNGHVANRQ
ncbi:MAG: DNA-binding response regulator [Candidatus Thermofonsia bacterium]|nr:MAG: DNA-binding response regulator [Candidatus Thermofonsia bacterium]